MLYQSFAIQLRLYAGRYAADKGHLSLARVNNVKFIRISIRHKLHSHPLWTNLWRRDMIHPVCRRVMFSSYFVKRVPNVKYFKLIFTRQNIDLVYN